jgi:hypothetical protein
MSALLFGMAAPPFVDCDAVAKEILVKQQQVYQERKNAHDNGDVTAEIAALRRTIDLNDEMANHCPKSGKYDRYGNLLKRVDLAVLLEGSGKWKDAEVTLRQNIEQAQHDSLAGDDTKIESELALAYLLRREGQFGEATKICSYWKDKAVKIGREAVRVAEHNVPGPDYYDTPDQEVGRWTLSCANEAEGIKILESVMREKPTMLSAYASLSKYYVANGKFAKGLELENDWHSHDR